MFFSRKGCRGKKEHSEDLGRDRMIILINGSYRNGLERYGLDSSGSGMGPVVGCCQHGNEPGFIR